LSRQRPAAACSLIDHGQDQLTELRRHVPLSPHRGFPFFIAGAWATVAADYGAGCTTALSSMATFAMQGRSHIGITRESAKSAFNRCKTPPRGGVR
jgi:hypothetical protein